MLRVSVIHGAPVWVPNICLIALAVASFRSTVKSSKTFKKFKDFQSVAADFEGLYIGGVPFSN